MVIQGAINKQKQTERIENKINMPGGGEVIKISVPEIVFPSQTLFAFELLWLHQGVSPTYTQTTAITGNILTIHKSRSRV